jgi:hypothetical protein
MTRKIESSSNSGLVVRRRLVTTRHKPCSVHPTVYLLKPAVASVKQVLHSRSRSRKLNECSLSR